MQRLFDKPRGPGAAILWDLLTFERLMTNSVVHLIYWAGLGLIALAGSRRAEPPQAERVKSS